MMYYKLDIIYGGNSKKCCNNKNIIGICKVYDIALHHYDIVGSLSFHVATINNGVFLFYFLTSCC